jgi:hypothetical protein
MVGQETPHAAAEKKAGWIKALKWKFAWMNVVTHSRCAFPQKFSGNPAALQFRHIKKLSQKLKWASLRAVSRPLL